MNILEKFFEYNIIKFGTFTLKDGTTSPIYIDLRLLSSYPDLLRDITIKLGLLVENLEYDRIAGIPLAGLPLGTALGLHLNKPALLVRKERKEYGCKKRVEGVYQTGDTVLLIDDVITSANSKIEMLDILYEEGLNCKDIVVVVDRRNYVDDRFNIHSLFTLDDILKFAKDFKRT